MAVLDVPEPAFMQDEEIRMYSDAVGKFFDQKAPPKRIEKWREDGQVEPEFWREAGEAGLLGVSVPAEYGGHGGDFRHDLVAVSYTHLDVYKRQGGGGVSAQKGHPG